MLFNSNEFLVFLGVFLPAYYAARHSLRLRNLLIVLASLLFYGWGEPILVWLLLAVSAVNFLAALAVDRSTRNTARKAWLAVAILGSLLPLFIFKYLDFFGQSAAVAGQWLGFESHWDPFGLVLPIGISFYTFQALSYVIDVYRLQLHPTRSPIRFLGYLTFFPQLVAGPIERGERLLPQFQRKLTVNRADLGAGIWLMVWGMFKKVCVADNLAPHVDLVFQSPTPGGPMVVLGTVAFAFQIYCDFSGYTDIARGVARLLGFDLMLNFNLPYFATDLRDFWRRWHISLSTWLRDYLYVPMGGSRGGRTRTYLNLLVTMFLGGLWHGASWTFVLWGLWHGAGLALQRWWCERRPPSWALPGWLGWMLTLAYVFYGWLMFRAVSATQIVDFTVALIDLTLPSWWHYYALNLAVLIGPVVLHQVWQHRARRLDVVLTLPTWARGALQAILIFLIGLFWQRDPPPFIYFQF